MKHAPANYQDDLATGEEWQSLPQATRTAIVREHGYRKRPAIMPKPEAPAITPSISPSTRPEAPAPVNKPPKLDPRREAEGQRLAAMIVKFKQDAKVRQHFETFGAYLTYEGYSPETGFASGPGARAETVAATDPRLDLAARAAHEWRFTPKIRAEFHNNFDAYLAYLKAEERGSVGAIRRGGVFSLTDAEIAAAREATSSK